MALDHILSFQLYSSRNFPPVAAQLQALAADSYTNVEPYDDLYEDLEGFAAALKQNGLRAMSGHFSLSGLEADPDKAIGIANILGMSFIIAPWLSPEDRSDDAADWQALGQRLSALKERFAASGLGFAWHNHDFEFIALPDGSYPIEHLMEGTGIGLELDVAWVILAGQDPVVWLERYGDRMVAVHMKDIAPQGENLDQDGWTDIGKGVIDWKKLWPIVTATSASFTVAEHDNPGDWQGFASESAKAITRIASE